MRRVIIAVISRDGYISKSPHKGPEAWASAEDSIHFKQLLQQFPLHVMGIGTFRIHQPKPSHGTLRVVLTHSPEKYRAHVAEDRLEFMTRTPEEFVNQYASSYDSCAVLGGYNLYNSFLNAGLIDELYITREPITLGSGVPFLTQEASLKLSTFHLKSKVQLNKKGTQLEHYVLKK